MPNSHPKIRVNQYTVSVLNEEADQQTIDEVFSGCYDFKTEKKSPYIIDAGSNIGISTLYFKEKYPNAEIVCFEPDPNAYQLLKTNVEQNSLKGVSLINAALSDQEGECHLHGQIKEENPDTRGNSLVHTWGAKRNDSASITVKSVPLSTYLDREIDFLKLDIEGAEQKVLEGAKDKLYQVREACIEVHIADGMQDVNCLHKIKTILEDSGFDIQTTNNSSDVLPETIKDWVLKHNPELYMVRAIRKG